MAGLAAALAARGVETRPLFIPLHRLPPYRTSARKRRTDLPVTDRLGAIGLMLPLHAGMTDDDARFVCRSIRAIGAERMRSRRAAAAARIDTANPLRRPRAA